MIGTKLPFQSKLKYLPGYWTTIIQFSKKLTDNCGEIKVTVLSHYHKNTSKY